VTHAKPEYRPLPASTISDGLARAPLAAILARWPASCAPVARSAVEKHAPSGLIRYADDYQLTRWHVRWLASWLHGVMRTDTSELIELADAQGGAR
jgi:hypothetical protein